jgi:ADP-heptose:LPS heptosyltransferase
MAKYLIIRFSSIGDIVLTSPIVRCLKKQNEFNQIHFITKENYRAAVESNPNIDKIYTIKSSINEAIELLKNENYDYVIDLHKNVRSAALKLKLKRPSFSFHKLNFKKWLAVKFKMHFLPSIHIVDRYFDALEKLKIKNDNLGLDFFIDQKNEISIKNYLPVEFHTGYYCLIIGGAHETKKFPELKIIDLLNKINVPLVLLGDKNDKVIGDKICKSSVGKIFNSCGNLNLQQSASIIKQSHKVISNDTGLMHISAAFNKPIVSLWGNTIPEFGMYPYMPKGESKSTIIQVKNLSCRPCSKIGYQNCPKGHFNCMNLIETEEIIEALEKTN